MSAWGNNSNSNSTFKSCEALITRVEANDPTLQDLVILPMKIFGDAELDRLTKAATTYQHCKTLAASGHKVSPAALERFGKATKLTAIFGIGDSTMGDEGVVALCAGLAAASDCQTLEHLDLSYKGMGLTGFRAIAQLDIASLRHVNASRNALGSDALPVDAVPALLYRHVLSLDISSCEISSELAKELVSKLGDACSLQTLNISHNPIGDEGFGALVSYLPRLEVLRVSSCRLREQSITQLLQEQRCSYMVLDVSNNALTAASPWKACLATLLPQLQELNVSGNTALESDGVLGIVEGLSSSSNAVVLKELDLSQTKCGADAAVAALSCTQSLRLFDNQLGKDDGFAALATTNLPSTLMALDVAGNGADQASVVLLLRSVLRQLGDDKCSLTSLVVGGNAGGDDVEAVMREIQAVRPKLDVARDKKGKQQR